MHTSNPSWLPLRPSNMHCSRLVPRPFGLHGFVNRVVSADGVLEIILALSKPGIGNLDHEIGYLMCLASHSSIWASFSH